MDEESLEENESTDYSDGAEEEGEEEDEEQEEEVEEEKEEEEEEKALKKNEDKMEVIEQEEKQTEADESEEEIFSDAEEEEEEEEKVEEEQSGLGLETLMEENLEKNSKGDSEKADKELQDASAVAEALQPKGFTLSSTSVTTPIPFLLKHMLREYQHVGLDWLTTMYEKKLNGNYIVSVHLFFIYFIYLFIYLFIFILFLFIFSGLSRRLCSFGGSEGSETR